MVVGIIDGCGVAITVWSLIEADVATAADTADVTSSLGREAAVVTGTTPNFCVGAAGAAGLLVAELVDAPLPTLVLGAAVGA